MAVEQEPATNGVPAGWVVISESHADKPLAGNETVSAPGPDRVPYSADLSGRRSAATSHLSEEDYNKLQDPSTIAGFFEQRLRPLLEMVAHPKTVDEIASLLIPDAPGIAIGARAAMRGTGRALGATGRVTEAVGDSQKLKAAVAAGGGVTFFRHPSITNAGLAAAEQLIPPTVRATGRGMQAVGDVLLQAGARPSDVSAAVAARNVAAARAAKAAGVNAESSLDLSRRLAQEYRTPGTGAGGFHGPETPVMSEVTAPRMGPEGPPPAGPTGPPPTPPSPPPGPVAPPAPSPTPPPAAANNVIPPPSPQARAAVPVIRDMTVTQWEQVAKLPVEERQLYIRLRQVGDTHAEAVRTVEYARDRLEQAAEAQTARATMGTGDATRALYGTESAETRKKLLELAPGPSRQSTNDLNRSMDMRFRALISDPKMAWLLGVLGGSASLGSLARKDTQ